MLTRRQLLGGAAAGLALAVTRRAHAIGPGSKFRFGQLQLGTGNTWNPRPTALKKLTWEIDKRTSIDVDQPVVVTPTSDSFHETPIL